MVFTEKNLARQAVSDSTEVLYTVPASTSSVIKDIHICNNSASDVYFSLWAVPNGASPTDENIMFFEWNVRANDFVHWVGYQIIDTAGDTIRAVAETSDQLTISISGSEIT